MADPVNYAQISLTELEDGSIQYDIIPHDQTEERAIVLLDKDGVLSIRDEDGEYMPIAGTETAFLGEHRELGFTFTFPPDENTQYFEDPDSEVSIELSRNEIGSLVISVEIENETRSQYVGAVPESNVGLEKRTLIDDGQIGRITTQTSPGGVEPQNIPPSFKI